MATYRSRDSGRWQAQVRRQGYPAQSKTFRTKAFAQAGGGINWGRYWPRRVPLSQGSGFDHSEKTVAAL